MLSVSVKLEINNKKVKGRFRSILLNRHGHTYKKINPNEYLNIFRNKRVYIKLIRCR